MDNGLQIFSYEDFNVEVIALNDEVLFNAKQIGEVLELTHSATRNHLSLMNDKQKVKVTNKMIENSGVLNKDIRKLNNAGETFVTEKGLYRLIFASKKPSALDFQDWVTDEVLPSIRKTGSYSVSTRPLDSYMIENPVDRAKAWIVEYEEKLALENTIKEQAPKLEYLENVVNSEGSLTVTQIAKQFNMSAVTLNRILSDLKVQYKVGNQWVLHAEHMNMDLVETQTHLISDDKTVQSTKWTQKGKEFIYNILLENNYLTPILSLVENDKN